jgi:hypothetical protein
MTSIAKTRLLRITHPEVSEPLSHFLLKSVRVLSELKGHHKIIGETHQIHLLIW